MNKSMKLLSLLLCLAGGYQFEVTYAQKNMSKCLSKADTVITKQQEGSCVTNESGSKPAIAFKSGDLNVTVNGKTKIEGFFAKNTVFLNSQIPDEYHYFRQIADIGLDVSWGEQKYGHKAIQWFMDIRQRNMWGDSGRYSATDAATVKVDQTVLSGHAHKIGKPLLWVRDLWLETSVNAMFGFKTEAKHYVRFGLFPFFLGRGIAYGPYYGLSKEFLGIYTYANDQNPAGINIRGDIMKDIVGYDLYYSRQEEKGASLSDTFNYVKSNHVQRRQTPWRGVGKDNEVFAGRLKVNALKGSDTGNLYVEPYAFYNIASDQFVEFEADSKTKIGSVGLNAEYAYKGFEIGGDIAANYGQEVLYHIDRNRVRFKDDTTGYPRQMFTHIVNVNTGDPVEYSLSNINTVNSTLNAGNNAVLSTGGEASLKNAPNRYRPEYKNTFKGWMAVIDASYLIESLSLKPAVAFGYASGDENPRKTEVNKNYRGFIGINENYAGTRVPSILVLDARKMKRPLYSNPNLPEAQNDNSFSDLLYTGVGLSWNPLDNNASRFSVNPNVLFFWKDYKQNKVDYTTNEFIPNTTASKFLGTEFNLHVHYEVLKDLQLFGNLAAFLPGQFYRDIRGTRLFDQPYQGTASSPVTIITESEDTGLNLSAATRNIDTDDDSAFFFNAGLEYKF